MEIEAVVRAVHSVFATFWVGATVYVTYAVLPGLRDGNGTASFADRLSSRFSVVSIGSAVVLFVTGGHLAGTLYTPESLIGTVGGNLVLAMTALWLVLAGILHVGTKRLDDGVGEGKVREPASDAYPWFVVGSVLGVVLLVIGVGFGYV
ncbi:MAG: putative copper export protein [Methanobacteriota archaeon]|jgi:putative copper export protein|uniref:CopD family protein n=1 Tax=Halorutilus salinus TaxID=2487751 RepID=A0A9Q4GHX7_9EURY|nr:CopD family protein [Halorutilus salinus]MCX2819275.1 CopD family protein [Halorutilus salinus]